MSATTTAAAARTPSASSKPVRRDDPELASYLRIEERELQAGGLG